MYKMDATVRYSEVDQKGNLTIVALINYLQDCCAFHSDSVGYGLAYLAKMRQGWFITSWQLHIRALPRYGESITISTWPYEMKGMFARRNLVIEGEDGTRLVEANSLWVFMDLDSSRPTRLPQETIDAYGCEEPLPGEWKDRKIALLDAAAFETQKHFVEVMPVHLDTNRHMNNAYYIEIARDALEKGKKIYSIRVEYKRPAELGDIIHIRVAVRGTLSQVSLEDEDGGAYAVVEFGTD